MAKKKIMTVLGIQIEESMLQPTIAEMLMKEHFTASVFEETLRKNHTFVEHVIRESKISFDYAIRSYVLTGRASTTWTKALMKANPRKILSRIANAKAGADSEAMKVVHHYLFRHCGLEQMPAV